MDIDIYQLMAIVLIILVVAAPCVLPFTKSVSFEHKVAWFFASFILSWVGYFIYLSVVKKELKDNGGLMESD
ncbi:hypothetical protein [Kangiella aquimarina]|uniref:Superinfection immunity protein n=1 Tax=Kangiella aquimarina TaxID=261965 RepID=A0ABZ0X1W1_9GAMM|nr:hypothetical protein [Kangiella aquimarina]WQG84374.1 hypothetical protein SR900_07840 [Kangiella aquimarina]